ncbi:EexN family lipoprotein [Acidithiobacillus sp.]|uniref:EexN family lipoprotein n=1 Tax=Acidithiobacillus sp. TaxID=1872118 RepID=UPI003CFE6620
MKNGRMQAGAVILGLALAGCGGSTPVYTEHYYETHVPQMKAMYHRCKTLNTMTHAQRRNCENAVDAMVFYSTSQGYDG